MTRDSTLLINSITNVPADSIWPFILIYLNIGKIVDVTEESRASSIESKIPK